MKATVNDLVMELWLRRRDSGELKWAMKDGLEIPIKNMTEAHLKNAIRKMSELEDISDIVAENSLNIY